MTTTRKTILIYWQHTLRYRWLFFASIFGAAASVVVQDIVPPFIIASAFNKLQQVYSSGGQLEFSDLSKYLIAYLIFMLGGVILWRTQVILAWFYELKAMRDIANRLFDFIQRLGYRFHTNHFGGALVTQANRFINSYETLMDSLLWDITSGLTTIVASIVFLLFVSPAYALVLSVVSIIYLLIIYKRASGQVPYNRRDAARQSDQTAVLADAITNVNTITTFASEKIELNRFKKATDEKLNTGFQLFRYAMKTEIMSHSMTAMINVIAFTAGILAITHFHAKVSVLVLAVSYTSAITGRLWQFGRVVRNINKALGDAEEMTQILELDPEIKDPDKPAEFNVRAGKIEFDHVKFGYADNKKRVVFPDLNLVVPGGQRFGLVGHSGGGKTTITKLILRFMDIQGGRILIDGTDIRGVTQADLRSHISYVPQEPLLFHRSIAENIGYGKPGASQKEIVNAAKLAHAHEFIKGLPDGYETMVGERGVKLSGGQRQRVAIARAMLKNAPILVLDEATSALDSESEKLIQDALWKLMEGRTAIVIAHRLSTIQHMDRIVVLDNGKIVEQGSHKDLLKHDGVYASLWAHQSGGFLEE